jgi:hypothetical protein
VAAGTCGPLTGLMLTVLDVEAPAENIDTGGGGGGQGGLGGSGGSGGMFAP